jgi:hypothetical protein
MGGEQRVVHLILLGVEHEGVGQLEAALAVGGDGDLGNVPINVEVGEQALPALSR